MTTCSIFHDYDLLLKYYPVKVPQICFKDYFHYVVYYSLLDPNIAIIYEKDNPYKHFFFWFVYLFPFVFLTIFVESAILE